MPNQTDPHAVIEIVDTTDRVVGSLSSAAGILKAISASEAFRKYNWIAGSPALNLSGDFRGMVISAKWRTVFNVSSKVGDVLGNLAVIAALAGNIVNARTEIEQILSSNASADIKAAKISDQVASVAIRTVAGVVPVGYEALSFSLQGYCQIGGLLSGGRFNAQACINNLKSSRAWINTTYQNVTDGNNIYNFINVHIN